MTILIALDAGVLGRVTNPEQTRHAEECRQWLKEQVQQGARIVVPETAYYEVRRSLELNRKDAGIRALDEFVDKVDFIGNRETARLAASNWAISREQGRHTPDTQEKKNEHFRAIDSDTRLAAEAKLAPKVLEGVPRDARVVVATTNVRDLSLFIESHEWRKLDVTELMHSKVEWQSPQRAEAPRKEGKVLLDQGVPGKLFKEGMPRYDVVTAEKVVTVEKMVDLAGRTLNGGELLDLARSRGFEAIITTNMKALDEAERAAGKGERPVYLLALKGEPMKDEAVLRKEMPDIEKQIRAGIAEVRKKSQHESQDQANEVVRNRGRNFG